jgi:hypothetical protein
MDEELSRLVDRKYARTGWPTATVASYPRLQQHCGSGLIYVPLVLADRAPRIQAARWI